MCRRSEAETGHPVEAFIPDAFLERGRNCFVDRLKSFPIGEVVVVIGELFESEFLTARLPELVLHCTECYESAIFRLVDDEWHV